MESIWAQLRNGGPVLLAIALLSLLAWTLIVLEGFALRDAVRQQAPPVRPFRAVIGRLASLAPLLGLLGTVLGLMETFGVLDVPGTAAVPGLADGISRALITTQAGLLVALPILLARSWLDSRARHLELR